MERVSERGFGAVPCVDSERIDEDGVRPLEGSLAFDMYRVTQPIRENEARPRAHPSVRPEVIFERDRFRVVLSCRVAIGGAVHGSTGCGADGVPRF